VIFTRNEFGYRAGDIVEVVLNRRDDKGVNITMFDQSGDNFGALINAWSDLAGIQELNEMEVIAHAASGAPIL